MKPKSELMQALRDRRRKEGMRKVECWVPAAAVSKLRKYVARLVRV